jgi:lipoic acid synthetase
VLTPDFEGRAEDVDRVLDAEPEVFNHNVETVPALYPEVRPQAQYERSLAVLGHAADRGAVVTKSGLMVGLGEQREQLLEMFGDLRQAGCQVLTIGQYLRPSPAHHPVERFVEPQEFEELKKAALDMGFLAVASGPFVRSSYRAAELAARARERNNSREEEQQ